MTRFQLSCRSCPHRLAWINHPSGVAHLAPDTVLTFVDLTAGTATLRCGRCGATMQFTGGRVDLGG